MSWPIFKALVAPHDPSNEGWFRPLRVVAPDGTLSTATSPSPTGWYYEGSVHASELVWKALAPVMPDRFSAGSYTSLCATYIAGVDDGGEAFLHIEPEHGGWGACPRRDGTSGLIALTDGDTFNYSVELIESKLPLLVRSYAFNVAAGLAPGGIAAATAWYGNTRSWPTTRRCIAASAARSRRPGGSWAARPAVATPCGSRPPTGRCWSLGVRRGARS